MMSTVERWQRIIMIGSLFGLCALVVVAAVMAALGLTDHMEPLAYVAPALLAVFGIAMVGGDILDR